MYCIRLAEGTVSEHGNETSDYMGGREYLHQRLSSCQEWSCLLELTIVMFWQHCNIRHRYSGMYFTANEFPPMMFHSMEMMMMMMIFSLSLSLVWFRTAADSCKEKASVLYVWVAFTDMTFSNNVYSAYGFGVHTYISVWISFVREMFVKSELETWTAQTQAHGGNTVAVTLFRVCCEGSRCDYSIAVRRNFCLTCLCVL